VTERDRILLALQISANLINEERPSVNVALVLKQCDALLDRLNALAGLPPPLPTPKACAWLRRCRP
jgi:hypothetical protein